MGKPSNYPPRNLFVILCTCRIHSFWNQISFVGREICALDIINNFSLLILHSNCCLVVTFLKKLIKMAFEGKAKNTTMSTNNKISCKILPEWIFLHFSASTFLHLICINLLQWCRLCTFLVLYKTCLFSIWC